MKETQPIVMEARTSNPKKKISSASNMALVYDAQYLEDHGGEGG